MHRFALVTGASAGIGRELARQLVMERGWTVLATARRLDRLEGLAAELPPGRVRTMAGDLADADFRARLWDWAEATAGADGVGLVINNAGLGHYAAFADEDPDQIRRIVEVNLMALMDLTQRAARHMIARRSGQIVAVSSVLGFFGLPYSATYVATKHAVNGLVKSLDYELRGTGVRAWAACPGRTESEFHAAALRGDTPAEEISPLGAEPTARVVRGILRGLDRRATFVFPTAQAWATARASSWLAGPFDWFLRRWATDHFRKEMEQGRAAGE